MHILASGNEASYSLRLFAMIILALPLAHHACVYGHRPTQQKETNRNQTERNETSLHNVAVPYCALFSETAQYGNERFWKHFFDVYCRCSQGGLQSTCHTCNSRNKALFLFQIKKTWFYSDITLDTQTDKQTDDRQTDRATTSAHCAHSH